MTSVNETKMNFNKPVKGKFLGIGSLSALIFAKSRIISFITLKTIVFPADGPPLNVDSAWLIVNHYVLKSLRDTFDRPLLMLNRWRYNDG